MNRNPCAKRKPRKKCNYNNVGIYMILLGVVALAALVLPLKYWALFLSCALIIFGCLLIK